MTDSVGGTKPLRPRHLKERVIINNWYDSEHYSQCSDWPQGEMSQLEMELVVITFLFCSILTT